MLVIDDEVSIHNLITTRLRKEGLEVKCESEGEKGIYRWRIVQEPPPAAAEGRETGLATVRVVVERPAGKPLEVVTLLPAGEEP